MKPADLHDLLHKKFAEVNIEAAKKDIQPFLQDPMATEIWSKEFFLSLLPKLKTI
jgi:hypothetical protein